MNNITTYTASEARKKLYTLIDSASRGLKTYEIKLRGRDPVLLVSKDEVESWLETLDILSNKEEVKAIEKARREKETVSHEKVLKKYKIRDED